MAAPLARTRSTCRLSVAASMSAMVFQPAFWPACSMRASVRSVCSAVFPFAVSKRAVVRDVVGQRAAGVVGHAFSRGVDGAFAAGAGSVLELAAQPFAQGLVGVGATACVGGRTRRSTRPSSGRSSSCGPTRSCRRWAW
jgi:hypothetical protein